VIRFVLRSAINCQKAPGTVKSRLAAVRSFHLSAGLPDFLSLMPRLTLVLAGLKKRHGTKERRMPVTARMLGWLHQHLTQGGMTPSEGCLLWGALALGFFFLLRASEYLDVGYMGAERGLRGRDLRLSSQGTPCTLANLDSADELTLFIRGSKTDVYNRGQYRNHFKADTPICPVRAAVGIFRNYPQRFLGGAEDSEPLFRDPGGQPIARQVVSALLTKAATAQGQDEGSLSSHSLRFGGASALWAAYGDASLVKRWGRWSSESFQTYIWDSRSSSEGVSSAMASTTITPT
jgi:hypothetical protein